MPDALESELRLPRPRRGSPAQTRERLVAAAAKLFNRVGYHGTDSNRIAREAGYSPGVFYKHFADKREIFLEAYQTWVVSEWKAVEGELSSGGTTHATARRLVALWRAQAKPNAATIEAKPDVADRKPAGLRDTSVAGLRSRFGALTERVQGQGGQSQTGQGQGVNARPDPGSVARRDLRSR